MKLIYTFGAIILELGTYSKIIQILRLNSLLVSFEMINYHSCELSFLGLIQMNHP